MSFSAAVSSARAVAMAVVTSSVFDVLAGEARVLQLVAAPTQRAQTSEGSSELGPYRVTDRDVATSLGGAQSLLGEKRLADEPGSVVGQHECRLRIIGDDRGSRLQPLSRLLQPPGPVGPGPGDAFEVTLPEQSLDLRGTLRPSGHERPGRSRAQRRSAGRRPRRGRDPHPDRAAPSAPQSPPSG